MKDSQNLNRFHELIYLANDIREKDPCGAQLIRWAAHQLAKDGCFRCTLAYGRGYAAGYKAGSTEWQDGMPEESESKGAIT